MRFRSSLMALAAIATATFPVHALAWGFQGHKVVAALAWQYLTPNTQTRILNLLQSDTDTLVKPEMGELTFIADAPWADLYRNKDKSTGNWHFVDIPLAQATSLARAEAAEAPLCPHPTLKDSAAIGAPADDCVVDKITQFEAELQNPATPTQERVLALKFLVHFIGDVHQPLHAIDNNDKGGNCLWVKDGETTTRLHSWWDTEVVKNLMEGQTPQAYAAYLKTQITAREIKTWSQGASAEWAGESAMLGHDIAYKLDASSLPNCETDNKAAPIALPAGYDRMAESVAKSQLEKAGVRLAHALNSALG